MGVTVSSSHIVSAAPSSSEGGFLTLFHGSSMRSLSQETVLYKVPQHEPFPWTADLGELLLHGSFPWTAAVHELLLRGSFPWTAARHELLLHGSFPWGVVLHKLHQCGSLPRGAVLQDQAAPVWVLHGFTIPASKPAPAWGPLSTVTLVLPGAYSSTGSPQGHSFLQASTSSGMGSLPWLQGHMDCRGSACLTMVFIMSCKRRVSAPAFQAPPPPSFFTGLGVCRVASFTLSHSSFLTAVLPGFFPLLK